jgi:hypothetical protein
MATTLPRRMPLGTRRAAGVLTGLFDALIFAHFARAVMFASTLHGTISLSIPTVYDAFVDLPGIVAKSVPTGVRRGRTAVMRQIGSNTAYGSLKMSRMPLKTEEGVIESGASWARQPAATDRL